MSVQDFSLRSSRTLASSNTTLHNSTSKLQFYINITLNVLLCLTDSVACVILQDWLKLKSLVALDSAFCNKSEREELLRLLRSPAFILQNQMANFNGFIDCSISTAEIAYSKSMNWIICRQIPAQEIATYSYPKNKQICKYLGQNGSKIVKLTISDIITSGIIRHCHNLTFLDLQIVYLSMQLRDLLLVNVSLVEIRIKCSYNTIGMHAGSSPFWNVKLPQLRVLCYDITNFLGNVFDDALQMGSLITLKLIDVFYASQLSAIARWCPSLCSLALRGLSITDTTTLTEIVRSCTHVVHLDLEGTDITDEDMFEIVSNLSLQSLNIMHCEYLTSASLVHIYSHCADTLHTLNLNSVSFSRRVLDDLFAHCTHLHTLCWSQMCVSSVYLLPGTLHKVTTLILCDKALCDPNLLRVAQYCSQLSILNICSNSMC